MQCFLPRKNGPVPCSGRGKRLFGKRLFGIRIQKLLYFRARVLYNNSVKLNIKGDDGGQRLYFNPLKRAFGRCKKAGELKGYHLPAYFPKAGGAEWRSKAAHNVRSNTPPRKKIRIHNPLQVMANISLFWWFTSTSFKVSKWAKNGVLLLLNRSFCNNYFRKGNLFSRHMIFLRYLCTKK